MTRGYTRPSRLEDVPVIANDMRSADVAEVLAYSGRTPEVALTGGLQYPRSVTKTICLADGAPVGMYGICPFGPGIGAVWMLATNGIQAVHRQFLKESRREIDKLCKGYRLVFNFTDARNHVHHRWIKWAGFTIIKRHEEFGLEKRPFLEFVRITET